MPGILFPLPRDPAVHKEIPCKCHKDPDKLGQQIIYREHMREEEEDAGDGDEHALAGPDDALPGTGRRTHAFQAEDEKQCADKPGALDIDRERHWEVSFFLNMASMRSVTT